MKFRLLLIIGLFIASHGVLAQSTTDNTNDALVEQIQNSLGIDAQKATAITNILQSYGEQTAAIQQRKFGSPKNKQQAISSLKKAQRAELSDLVGNPKKIKELMDVVSNFQKGKKQDFTEQKQDINKAVSAYILDNVYPALIPVRQQLEGEIPASEQAKLADLRNDMMEANRAFKQQQRSCKQIRGKEQQKERKQCEQELDSKQDAVKAVAARQKALVTQLEDKIEASLNKLATQKTVWEAEVSGILLENYTEKQKEKLNDTVLNKQVQQYLRVLTPSSFLMVNADSLENYLMRIDENRKITLVGSTVAPHLSIQHLPDNIAEVVVYDINGKKTTVYNEISSDSVLYIPLPKTLASNIVLVQYYNGNRYFYEKVAFVE